MTAAAASFQEDDAAGKAYDARLARRLFRYVRPYGGLVITALVLLMIDALLQLVGPVLTKQVIDLVGPAVSKGAIGAALQAPAMKAVAVAAGLYTLSLVAAFGAQYGETISTTLLGQRVMRDLRQEIFDHVQRLPIVFFDRNPVGRLVTRMTSDVEALNELFTAGVVAGLGDLFTLVAITAFMIVQDWRLALATFAVIPFIYLASALFRRAVRTSYREIRVRLARINSFLQERITGMRVVQLFGREAEEAHRFDRLNRDHLESNLKSIVYYALYFPAIEVLTSVALASVIVAGARRVEISTLQIGLLSEFLLLARRFFQPLQDLSDKFNTLQQAMAASERIFRLLDTDAGQSPRERDLRGVREGIGGERPLKEGRDHGRGVTVAFEDVWFAYDVGHVAHGAPQSREPEWVLRGVSFRVSPGETLALVGHTGAGKTTIVNLLLRFYDPQRGRILIDGVDIRDVPTAKLRSLIGYVQQDIFLFAGDVLSNIRLSNPLTEEEVAVAASRVGADRVIRRLPHGYGQELGERGASISVGERQLLSFARAIAADPALLILDEATSAVDSQLESEIGAALDILMEGRTTIAIAHRLSTIVGATEILVLHHGQIRERGSHRTLMATGGLYQRLYRLQAGSATDIVTDAASDDVHGTARAAR